MLELLREDDARPRLPLEPVDRHICRPGGEWRGPGRVDPLFPPALGHGLHSCLLERGDVRARDDAQPTLAGWDAAELVDARHVPVVRVSVQPAALVHRGQPGSRGRLVVHVVVVEADVREFKGLFWKVPCGGVAIRAFLWVYVTHASPSPKISGHLAQILGLLGKVLVQRRFCVFPSRFLRVFFGKCLAVP